MPEIVRDYMPYTLDAVRLLGQLIKRKRKEKRMPAAELAERCGISRNTLNRIEQGSPKCEIGIVFEAATIIGVRLFDLEDNRMKRYVREQEEILELMPKSIRDNIEDDDDDF